MKNSQKLSVLTTFLTLSACAGTPERDFIPKRPQHLQRHRLLAPVLLPSSDSAAPDSSAVECPKVVRWQDHWFMFHTVIANEGETVRKRIGLAVSDDLIHWQKRGTILGVGPDGAWDAGGISAPFPFFHEATWYLFYDGFPEPGYEQGKSGIGLATSTDLHTWTRISPDPVLALPENPEAWDAKNLYQCFVMRGPDDRFWMYYNAGNQYGAEQIGLAFSDDFINWQRYPESPIITNGARQPGTDWCIAGDPWIETIEGRYHMFYFGYDCDHAREMVATSDDGLNWQKSRWNPILEIGEPGTYDDGHAHKPCLVLHDGVWYHFYTSEGTVNGSTTRGIALATSRKLDGVKYREK